MGTFRSIDELIRALDREKMLLKEMFAKRHSLQFRNRYRVRKIGDLIDLKNI